MDGFNMQLKWICILILVFCIMSGMTCLARDAGVQLNGVIKDSSGNPVPNISITVPGTNCFATTDAKGRFTLSRLTPGQTLLLLNGNKGTGQVMVDLETNPAPQTFTYPVITKVIFLHINDPHGQIDNFPKLAAYVAMVKKNNPNVFLVCAGDIFSGNPVVDQYSQKGYPIIALMNACGFDAMTLGNRDFDYGQEFLAARMQDAVFPILGANIQVVDGLIPEPIPYINLKTENGLNIGVLGLVQVNSESDIPDTNLANIAGIKFSEPFFAVNNYEFLENECTMLVGLTHLGEETDKQLGRQVGGLDLIIGGHSHTQIDNPRSSGNALVVQAKSFLQFLGRVDITLENDKVKQIEGQLIDFANLTEIDRQMQDMVDNFNNNAEWKRIIGSAPVPISGKDELGSLMTDAMCKVHELDIAFQNNAGIGLTSLERDITVDQMYELEPCGNEVIRFDMTPAEIRTLIAYSCREKTIDLQVSGITYTVKLTGDLIKEVELLDINGRPLDENQIYQVGMNAYVANHYEFTHQDPGKSTFVTVTDTLISYIEGGAPLTYTGVQRAGIIQE